MLNLFMQIRLLASSCCLYGTLKSKVDNQMYVSLENKFGLMLQRLIPLQLCFVNVSYVL